MTHMETNDHATESMHACMCHNEISSLPASGRRGCQLLVQGTQGGHGTCDSVLGVPVYSDRGL